MSWTVKELAKFDPSTVNEHMAYTLKEFLALDLSKRKSSKNCVICSKDIGADEYRTIKTGWVHDDCYFDEFSDFLDKNPITKPI